MKKGITLLLCTALSVWAEAQVSVSDSLTKMQDSLKEVTVTATRTSKDIMDVGRSVTVITNEQIKQASCNTVAELLSQQEGVFIIGTGQNPGAIQSLFMRGADNNNTTIMVDGARITDPSTDHDEIDLNELSLADVDRIEIVRGSHSTLYGSSSIGGVINIITKKNYAHGFHISASVTGGEFGAGTQDFEGNALLNYTFKNGFYLTAGYHALSVKGLNATVDTVTNPATYQQNPDRDNTSKSEPFFKVGFVNNKWDIYAEYKNLIQQNDIDAGAFKDAKNDWVHFVRDFYTGSIKYKFNDNLSVQYIGSYSSDHRRNFEDTNITDAYNDKVFSDYMFKGTTMEHQLQLNGDVKGSHFMLGVEQYQETMDINTFDWTNYYSTSTEYISSLDSIKPKQTLTGIFAQADISGGTFTSSLAPLSLLVGGRYTNSSAYGNNLSYEVNPYCKINANTTMFFSYSTGFTTPSLYQLFSPKDYVYNEVSLGNKKLQPEESTSLEIGLKHRIGNNLFFTLSWFKTTIKNYIDYVYLWTQNRLIDSLGYADYKGDTYLNIGQQTTQGFELTVALKASSKIDVGGNVSLLSSTLQYNPSNIDTAQTHGYQVQIFNGGEFLYGNKTQNNGLLRRPGSLGNFYISYRPVKQVAITLRARYVGTRFDAQYDYTLGPNGAIAFANVGDYTLLDASVSYEYDKHLSAMLRCENLFNTTYSEILGYTTRGRGFYLNLRYSL